jgi:hypothetical protein
MKQSDIFTIIIIASIGMVGAFFASNAILGNPDELMLKHKNISPISTEVVEPDPETFNQDAINPTVEVYVGQCEDVDQNGILDRAELVACGKATPQLSEEEKKAEEEKKKAEEEKKKTEGQAGENNSSENNNNATQNGQAGQNNSANNGSESSNSQNGGRATE